jgi:uncharacterized protein (TIGR02996 family)
MLDPTEAALIESARERTDDLTCRLAHADWLEEHGESDLAALIRISCELPAARSDPPERMAGLIARRSELFAANEERWPVPLLEQVFVSLTAGGSVYLPVDMEEYPTWAEVMMRLAPLASVELFETTRGDDRVLLPDAVFEHVAALPALGSWASLSMPDCLFSPTGFGILLASPHLTHLRALDLFESFAGDDVLAWINVPRWPRLTKLHLNGVVQGDERTATLVRSGHLRGLKELTLIYNEIGDAGAVALASSPDLAGLTLLELYGNQIGDEGALALALSPHLRNLRSLNIESYGATTLSPGVQDALRGRFGYGVVL